MSDNKTNLNQRQILIEIENVIEGKYFEFNNKIENIHYYNEDCVSLYDIMVVCNEKYEKTREYKSLFEKLLNKELKKKKSEWFRIDNIMFDYNSNQLKFTIYNKYLGFSPTVFSKNSRRKNLQFHNVSFKGQEQQLYWEIGPSLNVMYDWYSNLSFFFTKKFEVKSVNGNFFIEFYSRNTDINVYLKNYSENYIFKYDRIFGYDCIIDRDLRFDNMEESAFKNIFVSISDCPEWIRYDLEEKNKEMLKNNKKVHKRNHKTLSKKYLSDLK